VARALFRSFGESASKQLADKKTRLWQLYRIMLRLIRQLSVSKPIYRSLKSIHFTSINPI